MNKKDKAFVIGAIAVCLILAVLSPFIASSNPDGLEKSAQNVGVPETESTISSPFQDYTIGGLGKIGGILSLIIGIIITLGIAWLVAILIKRRKPPELSE
jgi:cobalt/nickel transport protein